MSLDYSKLNWKHYRELCKMSVKGVAECVGVHVQTIWGFENERQKPNDVTKHKILDLYKNEIQSQIRFHEKQVKQLKMALIAIDKVSES